MMKYIGRVIVKIVLMPLALVMFILAYVAFAFHPEFNKFKFKLEH